MARTIRIIYPQRELGFSELLERRVQAVVSQGKCEDDPTAPVSILERQLALTTDRIQRLRALHEELGRNLLRLECYIRSEIIQREPRPPVYRDERLPERDMLRARLLKIEHERRQLAVSREEQLQELHERLLTLLNQRDQLRMPNDGWRGR